MTNVTILGVFQGEHSAILSTFIKPLEHSTTLSTSIKVPLVIKIFVLSIFEWPLKTGFTVCLSENISAGETLAKQSVHPAATSDQI